VVCNHPSLGGHNGIHMQRLYQLLLTHYEALCLEEEHEQAQSDLQSVSPKLSPSLLPQLDLLQCTLFDLGALLPAMASRALRLRLARVSETLLKSGSSTLPTAANLLFFKLLTNLVPTSDFRHAVVTPMLLLLSHSLTRKLVSSRKDVSLCLFIMAILVHCTRLSKRHIPELYHAFTALFAHGFGLVKSSSSSHKTETQTGWASVVARLPVNFTLPGLWSPAEFSVLQEESETQNQALALVSLFLPEQHTWFNNQSYVESTLATSLHLIAESILRYKHSPNCPEFTATFLSLTKRCLNIGGVTLNKESLNIVQDSPQAIRSVSQLHQLLEKLQKQALATREPLVRLEGPKQIKSLTPAFLDIKGLRTDKDENKILSRKIKREKAGAMAELRKDAQFLATERKKQQEKIDLAGAKKLRAVMNTLEDQQRDTNILSGKTKARGTKKERRALNTRRSFRG